MPALLTKISTAPYVLAAKSTIELTSPALETSTAIATAFHPFPVSCAADFSAASLFRSAMTTEAPASARRYAIPHPMPIAPPVTIATFPERSIAAFSESGSIALNCTKEKVHAAFDAAGLFLCGPAFSSYCLHHLRCLCHCRSFLSRYPYRCRPSYQLGRCQYSGC